MLTALLFATAALAGDTEATLSTVDESEDAVVIEGGPVARGIINGESATREDFPMTGGLIFDGTLDMGSLGVTETTVTICSTTLIAPDVVLLAAHCVSEEALTYGFGEVRDETWYWSREADLSDYDGSRVREVPADAIAAVAVLAHEDFDMSSFSMGIATNFDIALMFLEEAVTDVPFAWLPQDEAEADQVEAGAAVTIVGWGQQEATGIWEAPAEGTVYLKMMGESVIGEVGEAEFQVGPDEDDVRKCHGDSGGPTFQWVDTELPDTMRLIGVTSHSYDSTDCNETGGVDTRVSAYLGWIDAELRRACEDGTRVWCEEPGIPVQLIEEDQDLLADGAGGGGDKGCGGCSAASASPVAAWGLLLGLGALVGRRRR